MSDESTVAVYATMEQAEEAVRKLDQGHYPIKQISIVAQKLETDKDVNGFITRGEIAVKGAGMGAGVGTVGMGHIGVLKEVDQNVAVRCWGIDLVVAHASVLNEGETDALVGERWVQGTSRHNNLRVPIAGTLDALEQRYRGFL